MAYFKKFVVALKKMGIKINPGVVLMLILAVTIAVVLWRWWLAKKRSADEAGTETSPKPQVPAGPAAVPKDRFLKIWRRFTSELPSIVRRSIYQYQPMVVLGGLSAGKTALITRYTDWQRQVRYLVGSQLDDPDLQLYLGSRVLVLELPPSVLAGAGRGLRESLLALFRILFSRRTPIVVVALNPIELQQMTPDELRALADAVRGKINLLSFVRRKPIEVRLAVTHMDRVSGFAELSEVVRQQSGSLELPMPAQAFGTELEVGLLEQLGQLAKVRSTALLSLSATRYLKVISFLKEAPQILAPVGRFARALLAPEPMSIQPSLSSIHLTSAQLEEPVSAPFWAPEPLEDRLRSPLAWHRAAAVSVAAILCCGLMWTYFSERGLWVQTESALQRYASEAELRQRPELERALRAQIMGFVHRTTFPSFFGGAERRARRVVAERLHQDFVLHNLRDALAHPRGIRRAVYLSALAGFRPEGDVALLLDGEDALGQWELSTGLKGAMIRDYVDVVGAFKRDFDAVPALASPAWKDGSKDNVNNIDTLYAFAQDVRAAVRRNVIDGRSLADIRQQAGRLRQGLTEIAISPDVAKILHARASEDPDQADVAVQLAPHLIELQAPDLLGTPDRRTELRSFLELVESTQVGRSPRAAQRYLDICEWLSTTLKIPTSAGASNSDPTDIEVAVDGRLLRGSEWLGLTRDHTVVEVVRSYLSRPSRETAVFFTPGVEYPSLVMNPDTRGAFLFSGRARIAGRFTRTALLSDVAPVLECHAKVLPALGRIDSKTAKDLDALVKREIEHYTEVYERSLLTYYRAFEIQSDGAAAKLRVILDRLLSGSSPLSRHLSTVGENARFDSLIIDARRQLAELVDRLEPFQALDKVVSSTVSGEPAYQSYLLLLRQAREALLPTEVPASAGVTGVESLAPVTETLRDRLGPAGKMALDILTCSPDSKDLAVRQWLKDVGLNGELRRPFLVPIEQVYEVGRREIEQAMHDVWRYDLRKMLDPLLLRFPFNQGSPEDATPEQVTALLHPVTGSLASVRARLIAPLMTRPEGCEVRYRPVRLPSQIGPLLARTNRLVGLLWDEGGQPKAISVAMTPVPFESRVTDDRNREVNARMTLSFISGGASTLVNFNQRPFPVGLLEPWTTVHTAQAGIQLTDLTTQDEIYPDPIVESSHWALLRLLYRAERQGRRFAWTIRFGIRGAEGRSTRVEVPIGFEAERDPFDEFSLLGRTGQGEGQDAFGGPNYQRHRQAQSYLKEAPR